MAAGLDRHPDLVRPSGPPGRPRPLRTLAPRAAVMTVLLGASVLAGCTGPRSAAATPSQVASWLTGADAGTAIGQVEADSRNVAHVLATHQPASAVKTVCALLTTDALTAIGNLPSPDLGLTDALNAAYEKASAAGNDCFKGASGDRVLLRRSASERAALVPLLQAAVDRYRTLTGHAPSTSTTLAPAISPDPFSP